MTEARGQTAGTGVGAYVQSLERGIAVITAFDRAHCRMTLSEVAQATRLNRAAARRFLLTLIELGYVGSENRHFFLRPRVLDLGYAFLSALPLSELAGPRVKALSEQVGESCSIAELDGADIRYVARHEARRIMSVRVSSGTRFPASATALGRVLLAALDRDEVNTLLDRTELVARTKFTVTDRDRLLAILDEVAAQGYALVNEELELGLRSVAVPIHGQRHRVIAALNVSTHVSRESSARLVRDVLPRLRATAAELDRDLAFARVSSTFER